MVRAIKLLIHLKNRNIKKIKEYQINKGISNK